MVLTNQQIIDLSEGLASLRNSKLKELPISVCYTLIKDIKLLEPLYESAMSMVKTIGLKYGELKTDGNIVIENEENRIKAQRELDELSKIENHVDLETVNLSQIGNYFCSLDDMFRIYPLINGEA